MNAYRIQEQNSTYIVFLKKTQKQEFSFCGTVIKIAILFNFDWILLG